MVNLSSLVIVNTGESIVYNTGQNGG